MRQILKSGSLLENPIVIMLSQQKVIRIGTINNYKSVMLGFPAEVWWLVKQHRRYDERCSYIMYDGYYHELYEQGDFFEDDDDLLCC